MKFSYNWLKELSGTKKSPKELAEFLTLRAFEVEEVVNTKTVPDSVVVGEVLAIGKHPQADRLRIATVSVGKGDERTIVCGAPNLALGQKVSVAVPGTVLPGGVEIREVSIRGIDSSGMICSEKELGLGENHEGILILDKEAKVGSSLLSVLGAGDSVLDVKILPDRAHDCLSHVGLAREIAALEGRMLDYDYAGLVLDRSHRSRVFEVRLAAREKSQRYIGALIRDVKIAPSPKWLSVRLETLGLRSVNAVVDATNYVMLELGQPLHAFDWNKISGKEKIIGPRFAREGECITLLDGRKYELSDQDMVIADEERALALAGIMGGQDSAITGLTTDIFLEAAHFDAVLIRRTRTRLGLRTDASDRFEKGLSRDLAERALVRVLEILSHVAGGKAPETHDVESEPLPVFRMNVDPEEVSALLGLSISGEKIAHSLELRGFGARVSESHVRVVVPSYRLDIETSDDIAEEIGKHIGYSHILPVAPLMDMFPVPMNAARELEWNFVNAAASNGFSEVYLYSFNSLRDIELSRLSVGEQYELANPMNPNQQYIRRSLVPGLLRCVSENSRNFERVSLVECGRGYDVDKLPEERRFFSGVFWEKHLPEDGSAFFQLKRSLIRMMERLGAGSGLLSFVGETGGAFWHPARTAGIFIGTARIGTIGEIYPQVSQAFGIRKRVACFEIDREALLLSIPETVYFQAFSKYPEVLRDLSFFVPERTSVADVERVIREAGNGHVLHLQLFDRYSDAQRGVSLAFHIRFGQETKTLSGEEAEASIRRIIEALEKRLQAQIRRD